MCVSLSSNIEEDNKKFYRKPGNKSGQGGDVRHKSHHLSNKHYMSKIHQNKEDMLEVGAMKHAAQVTQSLLNIAKYVQIKMVKLIFEFPDKPETIYEQNQMKWRIQCG